MFYAHSKTFKALVYKVHCTVIFAIAHFSCFHLSQCDKHAYDAVV